MMEEYAWIQHGHVVLMLLALVVVAGVGIAALPWGDAALDKTIKAVTDLKFAIKWIMNPELYPGKSSEYLAVEVDYDPTIWDEPGCYCGECWYCKGYYGDEDPSVCGDTTQESPWAETQDFDAQDIRTQAMKDWDNGLSCYDADEHREPDFYCDKEDK